MNILIVGAGEVGVRLAKDMSDRGHKVKIIEKKGTIARSMLLRHSNLSAKKLDEIIITLIQSDQVKVTFIQESRKKITAYQSVNTSIN